jgi:solute carrier family 25 protein 38
MEPASEPRWTKSLRQFLSGAVSGTVSAVLLQPFDVIKTSQQAAKPDARRGLLATGRTLVSTEGIGAAWKGTGATVIRVFFGVGLYFVSLHTLLDLFNAARTSSGSRSSESVASFAAGALGRSFAAVVMSPVTVVKTRMEAAARGQAGYTSTLQAVRHILRSEGVASLYSGVLPTIVRDAPFSGVYYATYAPLKQRLTKEDAAIASVLPPVAARTFLAGVLAGAFATTVTHPADVLKTRLQLKSARGRFVDGRILLSELAALMREEGPRALLVGVQARIIKRAVSSALTWTLFEEVMRRTGLATAHSSADRG